MAKGGKSVKKKTAFIKCRPNFYFFSWKIFVSNTMTPIRIKVTAKMPPMPMPIIGRVCKKLSKFKDIFTAPLM